MSKYSPIRDWLRSSGQPTVTLSFDQLSQLVGGLPPSAYNHRPWWANETGDTRHVQATDGWMAAGYRVIEVDREARLVTFKHDTD